jgi:hypothetical protein
MTQRTHLPAASPIPSAMDLALRWGYMSVCLVAVAAATAIAGGATATAELKLATAATSVPAPPQDICSAAGAQPPPTKRACANTHTKDAAAC